MNLIQVQDKLKNLSEQQLAQEMQMPTGIAPQFLVLTELQRRQKMRQDYQARQNAPQSTVAQDAVAAAGMPQPVAGQMAQSMAPQTDMAQNTGIMSVAPQPASEEPQRMAAGGQVRHMAEGRIIRNGRVYIRQPDGSYVPEGENPGILNTLRTYLHNAAQPDVEGYTAANPVRDQLSQSYDQGALSSIRATLHDAAQPDVSGYANVTPESVRGFLSEEAAPEMQGYTAANPIRDQLAQSYEVTPLGALRTKPLDTTGLDRRAQFEPVGDGMGLEYLPPEVDKEYYARKTAPAQHLSDIIAENIRPLSKDEAAAQLAQIKAEYDAADTPVINVSPDRDRQGSTKDVATAEASAEEVAAAKTAAEEKAAQAAQAGQAAASIIGSGGSAGPQSDYEKALADALQRTEKRANQDKWLALAQAGMALMSSKEPTLMGAMGEAGLKGLEQFQSTRDAAEKDRMGIMAAQYQMDMDRQKAAMERAAMAAQSAAGTNGYKTGQRIDDLRNTSKDLAAEIAGYVGVDGRPIPAFTDQYEQAVALKKRVDSELYALIDIGASPETAGDSGIRDVR